MAEATAYHDPRWRLTSTPTGGGSFVEFSTDGGKTWIRVPCTVSAELRNPLGEARRLVLEVNALDLEVTCA